VTDSDGRVRAAAEVLTERLGERLGRDVPLAPMTTYRVGGPAALFVDAVDVADLMAVAEAHAATGVAVLVVGRGSNMLVADTGFAGVAVSVANWHGGAGAIELDTEASVATAGGGVALPVLARRAAAAALTGFEWAVGVPGSIGGAVRMNAGGHGSDMAASLIDVRVFDLAGGGADLTTVRADEIGLRFRASSLAPAHVVISARLQLAPGDRERSEAEIAEIVRWRREHQPGGQNCGSVFVNPVPGPEPDAVTAGGLIDSLGLRGARFGTAWVSEKHANFIQAADGGSAADVRRAIEAVRERVAEATGYRLRSEVRLVGFDDADPLSFDEHPAGQSTTSTGVPG
jgi:UDP-N-acetylmuramate dehydrogenase